MLNFKVIKNISRYAFVLFFFIFGGGALFAEDKGQIININQNYQIAFTDLGNNVLRQGDIVKVSLSADDFVYMQVLEASPILSKLGPSQLESFQTNLKDFQSMAVGDEVLKVNQNQEKVDQPVDTSGSNDTAELSGGQIQKLEEDLAIAKEEIKRLEASNEESKAKLNELAAEQIKKEEPLAPEQPDNKEVLEQLKIHLDNMHKLIDDNN